MPPHALELGGRPLPEQHEDEEREGRTGRVRDRDQHELAGQVVLCRECRDRGEDRPGTGCPDDREGRAEHESGAEPLSHPEPSARSRRERLEHATRPVAERREQEHESDDREQHDRDRVQQILRQVEGREHARGRQGEGDERACEAEGDAEWTTAPGRRRRRENDRNEREHTRREEGGQTRHEGGEQQRDAHGRMLDRAIRTSLGRC